MGAKIVIGSMIAEEAKKIADFIKSLNSNEVTSLDVNLFANVRSYLPATLQEIDSFYGLKLILKSDYNMAHSGWLYSRYHEACKTNKIDPTTIVTFFSDHLFREYNPFGIMNEMYLLLGFGLDGRKMLKVILEAENKYDSSIFDSDGYIKVRCM